MICSTLSIILFFTGTNFCATQEHFFPGDFFFHRADSGAKKPEKTTKLKIYPFFFNLRHFHPSDISNYHPAHENQKYPPFLNPQTPHYSFLTTYHSSLTTHYPTSGKPQASTLLPNKPKTPSKKIFHRSPIFYSQRHKKSPPTATKLPSSFQKYTHTFFFSTLRAAPHKITFTHTLFFHKNKQNKPFFHFFFILKYHFFLVYLQY